MDANLPKTINADWLRGRLKENDIVEFAYVADDSKAGQPVQVVTLLIKSIDEGHVKGINAHRILDGSSSEIMDAYRSFSINRIVADSLWLKLA